MLRVARQVFTQVEQAAAERFAPGEAAAPDAYAPGDFILTHGTAWTSWFIRFGQRIRFRGKDSRYAHWSHAALIVSGQGDVIEALGAGVQKRNIDVYKHTEYFVVRIDASPDDRNEEVAFAEYCLGESYGFLTIVSIALGLLTGAKFTFAFDGQTICSGLVARALERTTAIFNRTPSHIMPADLAKFYGVEPPPKGTPKGTPPPPREGVKQ
jgi:uncharacterized protein YycO